MLKINRLHRLLLAGLWANALARFAFMSMLPIYLNKQNVKPAAIGFVAFVLILAMRGLSPIFGACNDTFGSKKAIVAGFGFSSFGYFLCSVSSSIPLFVLGAALVGAGIGFVSVTGSTLIVMVSESKDQGNKALAMLYILINLAASLGPLIIAVVLLYDINLKQVLPFFVLTNAVIAISFNFKFPFPQFQNNNGKFLESLGTAIKNPGFRNLLLLLPPIWFLFSLMHTTLPVFLLDHLKFNESLISSMFTVNAVLVIIFGYPVNRIFVNLCERYQRSFLDGICVGALLMGIGIFCLLAADSLGPGVVYLFIVIFTFGELAFIPMIPLLINKVIDPQDTAVGAYFGLSELAWAVGGGISNVSGGYFIEYCRSAGTDTFAVTLGTFAIIISLFYFMCSNSFSMKRSLE